MKVLVTGNRGYIGSVLCKYLNDQGIVAHGVDNDQKASSSKYVMDTVAQFEDWYDQVADLGIDTIFHLAASADVGESVRDPAFFYKNNIGATSQFVLGLIRRGWKGNIIFSSTAAVYGESDQPVNENSLIGSPNPYGKSKYSCEQLLEDVAYANGIKSVRFRYFNVAGADGDVGDHLYSGHIIQRLCASVNSETNFKLFGNQKNTRDGTCVRDYIHVMDICRAHLAANDYLNRGAEGSHVFNLGTGRGFSNLEIIDGFSRFTGQQISYDVVDDRPGDPDFLVADGSKFERETGFRYTHSSLENIITTAWNYYNWRVNNGV